MRILVIPTTDWVGHPVPNRLNFIFDNIARRHCVDVCHFKLFETEKRKTRCNLIPMDDKVEEGISSYYVRNIFSHGKKISTLACDHDVIISANLIPGYFANLCDTPAIFDYLDYLPGSAAAYYSKPMDYLARNAAKVVSWLNLLNAEGIITPAEISKRYLENFVDGAIEVIPNGVDRSIIHASKADIIKESYELSYPVLGYVGSLEKWVDLEFVIDLLPEIKKRYKNAKLLIIGPGLHTDYAARLREKVEAMDISDSVIFLGRIPYKDLAQYISSMDVGLNPRKDFKMNRMAMGSKVLTYLACEVPVLSSNMPEIEERFGPEEGVFRYASEEEFLGELHRAICFNVDPDIIKGYEWKNLSKKYERTIRRFIGY